MPLIIPSTPTVTPAGEGDPDLPVGIASQGISLFATTHSSCLCLPHLTVALCFIWQCISLPHLMVALSASPHCGSLFASPHCGSLFASPHCGFASLHCGSLPHLTVALCLPHLTVALCLPHLTVALRLFASPHCSSLCLTSLCSLCLTSLWLSLPHLTVALSASPHCGSLCLTSLWLSACLTSLWLSQTVCLTSLWLSLPHLTVALPASPHCGSASPHCGSLPHLTVTASPHCGSVSVFASPHCGSLYHLTVAMFASPHCGSLSVCLTWQWLYLCLTWRWLPSSPDSGSFFCLTLLWLSLFASLHNGSLLLCVWCWSCSLSTSKCTHHTAQDVSPGCPSEHELLTQLLASVLMPSSPPPLLISLSFHSCTLPVALFVPVLVPASSNFQYLIYKCKLKGDCVFLYTGPSVWH